jgi:hypothetical protein
MVNKRLWSWGIRLGRRNDLVTPRSEVIEKNPAKFGRFHLGHSTGVEESPTVRWRQLLNHGRLFTVRQRLVEGATFDAVGEVLLIDVALGKVVWVQVAHAVAQRRRRGVVSVAQRRRNDGRGPRRRSGPARGRAPLSRSCS